MPRSSRVVAVIAGNRREFDDWLRSSDCPGYVNSGAAEAVYVSGQNALRGLRNCAVKFVGTWRERPNLGLIAHALIPVMSRASATYARRNIEFMLQQGLETARGRLASLEEVRSRAREGDYPTTADSARVTNLFAQAVRAGTVGPDELADSIRTVRQQAEAAYGEAIDHAVDAALDAYGAAHIIVFAGGPVDGQERAMQSLPDEWAVPERIQVGDDVEVRTVIYYRCGGEPGAPVVYSCEVDGPRALNFNPIGWEAYPDEEVQEEEVRIRPRVSARRPPLAESALRRAPWAAAFSRPAADFARSMTEIGRLASSSAQEVDNLRRISESMGIEVHVNNSVPEGTAYLATDPTDGSRTVIANIGEGEPVTNDVVLPVEQVSLTMNQEVEQIQTWQSAEARDVVTRRDFEWEYVDAETQQTVVGRGQARIEPREDGTNWVRLIPQREEE